MLGKKLGIISRWMRLASTPRDVTGSRGDSFLAVLWRSHQISIPAAVSHQHSEEVLEGGGVPTLI